MRFRFQLFTRFLIAVLLVGVGIFGQYRFRIVERYVANRLEIADSGSNSLAKIFVNQHSPKGKPSLDLFWEVWQFLEQDYLEPQKVEPTKMVDGAVQGMVAALGDPYTTYLPPKQNQRSGEDLAGAFFGVGIELGYNSDGIVTIITPLKDSPAEQAGVQAGDLILKVTDPLKDMDDETTGWTLSQAVDAIRGQKGTAVTLTLLRPEKSNQPFEVKIIRDEIVVKSVELELIEHQGKKIAHIKLYRFGGRTKQEWDDLVAQIVNNPHIKGIILDMRGNPGGFFDEAIDVASEFIQSGTVVIQKGKYTSREFAAQGNAKLAGYPLVVLVNKGSASAAEIVAGALRDRLDVELIGTQTFGKGTVQDRRELSNGGGLHVTVARWLLPEGEWIQHEGISVDIEVKDDPTTQADEQLNRALSELD